MPKYGRRECGETRGEEFSKATPANGKIDGNFTRASKNRIQYKKKQFLLQIHTRYLCVSLECGVGVAESFDSEPQKISQFLFLIILFS